MAAASLFLRFSLQLSCSKQTTPSSASTAHLKGPSTLRPHLGFANQVERISARSQSRGSVLPIRAVASAEPSTVKTIVQGRHIEVTSAIKKYVVRLRLQLCESHMGICTAEHAVM